MYQAIRIVDYDEDGDKYTEYARANANFFGAPRYYYVLLRRPDPRGSESHRFAAARLLLIFTAEAVGRQFKLCLVEVYELLDEPHPTGLQVLQSPHSLSFAGRRAVPVSEIERTLFVVPDYATQFTTRDSGVGYERYLLVQDVDRDCWRRFGSSLPLISDAERL